MARNPRNNSGAAKGQRRQQRAPAPRAQRAQPRPRPQKMPKQPSSLSKTASLHNYDPRTLGHLPGPRATAPYTVVRERVNINFASNIFGQDTLLMAGPYQAPQRTAGSAPIPDLSYSATVAVTGVGANAVGTGEVRWPSTVLAGVAHKTKSVSMHSMTIQLACSGTSAGTVPSGLIWAGTVSQPFNRHSWATYGDIAANMKTRRGMAQYSGYELMTNPLNLMSYPLDAVAHSEFMWMDGGQDPSDDLFRSMAPLMLIVGPTSAAVDYAATVVIEWRVREAIDPILQSTHKHFHPTSESVWSQLSQHLSDAGGIVKGALESPLVRGAVRAAVQYGSRNAPRALAFA